MIDDDLDFLAPFCEVVGKMHTRDGDGFHALAPLFPFMASLVRGLLVVLRAGNAPAALALCRPLFETTVNAGFILAGGPERDAQMHQYSRQHLTRNLERTAQVGAKKIDLRHPLAGIAKDDEHFGEDLAAFSRKNGSERRQWCDENIAQRIEAIEADLDSKLAIDLHFCMVLSYRGPSEVLHGTTAGAFYGAGAQSILDLDPNHFDPSKAAESVYYGKVLILFHAVGRLLQVMMDRLGEHKDEEIASAIDDFQESLQDKVRSRQAIREKSKQSHTRKYSAEATGYGLNKDAGE